VDVGVSSDPGDSELVDVHLPEGVHMPSLEPLERQGLANYPDHEPMPLEDAMDGLPAQLDPAPAKDGVNPHGSPGGVLPPQLEDTIDEVPMGAKGAVVRTPGLVAEALYTFLSVVSAPTA
jgi:hypothetical protein